LKGINNYPPRFHANEPINGLIGARRARFELGFRGPWLAAGVARLIPPLFGLRRAIHGPSSHRSGVEPLPKAAGLVVTRLISLGHFTRHHFASPQARPLRRRTFANDQPLSLLGLGGGLHAQQEGQGIRGFWGAERVEIGGVREPS